MVKKKIIQWNSLKYHKADFIQDHHNRDWDHQNGILQWERETRLNSECSMGKWEFIAKEQGGVVNEKSLRGNIQAQGCSC